MGRLKEEPTNQTMDRDKAMMLDGRYQNDDKTYSFKFPKHYKIFDSIARLEGINKSKILTLFGNWGNISSLINIWIEKEFVEVKESRKPKPKQQKMMDKGMKIHPDKFKGRMLKKLYLSEKGKRAYNLLKLFEDLYGEEILRGDFIGRKK